VSADDEVGELIDEVHSTFHSLTSAVSHGSRFVAESSTNLTRGNPLHCVLGHYPYRISRAKCILSPVNLQPTVRRHPSCLCSSAPPWRYTSRQPFRNLCTTAASAFLPSLTPLPTAASASHRARPSSPHCSTAASAYRRATRPALRRTAGSG